MIDQNRDGFIDKEDLDTVPEDSTEYVAYDDDYSKPFVSDDTELCHREKDRKQDEFLMDTTCQDVRTLSLIWSADCLQFS